jgi:hypothetical protein
VVGMAYALCRALSRWQPFALARTPTLYLIGIVAAYWSCDRIVGMAG